MCECGQVFFCFLLQVEACHELRKKRRAEAQLGAQQVKICCVFLWIAWLHRADVAADGGDGQDVENQSGGLVAAFLHFRCAQLPCENS